MSSQTSDLPYSFWTQSFQIICPNAILFSFVPNHTLFQNVSTLPLHVPTSSQMISLSRNFGMLKIIETRVTGTRYPSRRRLKYISFIFIFDTWFLKHMQMIENRLHIMDCVFKQSSSKIIFLFLIFKQSFSKTFRDLNQCYMVQVYMVQVYMVQIYMVQVYMIQVYQQLRSLLFSELQYM